MLIQSEPGTPLTMTERSIRVTCCGLGAMDRYAMIPQDRRRSEHDPRADHTVRAHEQRTDTGDHPIRRSEVLRPLPRAIENQQLMLDRERFSHDRPQTAGARQPSQCGDQVDPQDDAVARRDILAISPRITRLDI